MPNTQAYKNAIDCPGDEQSVMEEIRKHHFAIADLYRKLADIAMEDLTPLDVYRCVKESMAHETKARKATRFLG